MCVSHRLCGRAFQLWRHYYQNTHAVIFVVDANDRERIDDASEELNRMLREDEIRGKPLGVIDE